MCESMCCVHCGVVFVCVVWECGGWRSARSCAVWSMVISNCWAKERVWRCCAHAEQ